jgi:uncharacterized protein YodC (DUF2158 family)
MLAGDVVKLKSGGLEMVVESVNIDTRKINCVYMKDGVIYRPSFNDMALVVIRLHCDVIIYWLVTAAVLGFWLGRWV